MALRKYKIKERIVMKNPIRKLEGLAVASNPVEDTHPRLQL